MTMNNKDKLELDNVCREYDLAEKIVGELPNGDAKYDRVFLLHKVKSHILKADKLVREGKPVLDTIYEARDAIQEVFLSTHCMPVMTPPPLSRVNEGRKSLEQLIVEVEGWEQLNLPNIKK